MTVDGVTPLAMRTGLPADFNPQGQEPVVIERESGGELQAHGTPPSLADGKRFGIRLRFRKLSLSTRR
jgi:hypothetical protein